MVPPLCMTPLSGLKLLLLTVTAADAGGVVALAVNVTAVGRPVNVAVTVCGEVDPRLSVVVATPLALVVLWAGETAPSPDATAQLTAAPGMQGPIPPPPPPPPQASPSKPTPSAGSRCQRDKTMCASNRCR